MIDLNNEGLSSQMHQRLGSSLSRSFIRTFVGLMVLAMCSNAPHAAGAVDCSSYIRSLTDFQILVFAENLSPVPNPDQLVASCERQSSIANTADAQLDLGLAYLFAGDKSSASQILGSLAERNDDAKVFKAFIDQYQNVQIALSALEAAGQNNHAMALAMLATTHAFGPPELRDYAVAFGYAERAADLGSSIGMYVLGHFYHQGLFVDRDLASAHHWYRKASDAGHGGASGMLSIQYAFPETGVKDCRQARAFWDLAIAQGATGGVLYPSVLDTACPI